MPEPDESKWYTRPVLFVKDVAQSFKFYTDSLGFEEAWNHADGNRVIVAQVNRGQVCELILCENLQRSGQSRLFIELYPSELIVLKKLLKRNNVEYNDGFWGMPVIDVRDPDGNELFFPTGD